MNATQPAAPMTETQARVWITARDAYTKRVAKMTRAALAEYYRAELAERGSVSLLGGPESKHELIGAAILLRYPVARGNEAIHVLYHTGGITNDACAYCHPDPCPVCGALEGCQWTPGQSGAIVNGRHVNG